MRRLLAGYVIIGMLMVFPCQCFPQTRSPQRPTPARPAAPFMQYLKSFEETQYVTKVVLKNGLTVLVNEHRAEPVVEILARVRGGYASEPDDAIGISRLLERSLFYRTSTRAQGVIRQEIQSLGGVLHSETAYDHISYGITAPSGQWKKALEVQSDIYWNALFDDVRLKRASVELLNEDKEESDDPESFSREELLELAFPPGNLTGRILDRSNSLPNVTVDRLTKYYQSVFNPAGTLLVIAGDVTTSEVLTEVVRLYNKTAAAVPGLRAVSPVQSQTNFRYREIRGQVETPRVYWGFHTPPPGSEDFAALEVLSSIMGFGRGSVIETRLKDQKGIILDSTLELTSYPNFSYLMFGMAVAQSNIDKSEIALLTEIEILKREGPDEGDMERALAQLEMRSWLPRETVTGRATILARYESLGSWKDMDSYVARIREVERADVRRVAAKYLRLDNCALIEYLPSTSEARNLSADAALKIFTALLDPAVEQELRERESKVVAAVKFPSAGPAFKLSEIRFPMQTASILRGPDLFIREDHTAPLIQMGFFFAGGKTGETAENSGVTELMLRSMLRGPMGVSTSQFYRQLEIYGGAINGVVADDYFGISLSILSRNAVAGLEMIGDLVKSPVFDPDAVASDKDFRRFDIEKWEIADDYCNQLLSQALFQGHPYGRDEAESKSNLAKLTPEALQDWYLSHVKNRKPVVILIGDTLGTSLAEYFVKNFSGSRFQDIKAEETYPKALDKVRVEKTWNRSISLVALGFQAPPVGDEDEYAAVVLASYASGTGGQLTRNFVEKQETMDHISFDYLPLVRSGIILLRAAVSPGGEEDALNALRGEMKKIGRGPDTYRAYRAAINAAIGLRVIDRQARSWQIEQSMVNVLAGRGIAGVEEFSRRLQEISQEDLEDFAGRVLNLEKAATVRLSAAPK
jgi:zinc protease